MFNTLWVGSEADGQAALDSLAAFNAKLSAGGFDNSEGESQSPILSVMDGVGIITIKGAMLDGTFGRMGQYYDIVGYGDIQEALIQAVSSPDVQSIMMVYKSGGGGVAGISETGQLISSVDSIKPVITYTPSTMASAALWLGVSGRKILASETAMVGSIGVLNVLVSRSRQLKEMGVDAEVIRSGKYKALGHPVDELTDEARAVMQAQADYMAAIFLGRVAQRRGISSAAADARFGQGRMFIGEQAKSVGLVDDIVSYSQAFTATKSTVPPDNKQKVFAASSSQRADSGDNSQQPKGQPMALKTPHIPTQEELLAMANGVALGDETDTTDTPADPAASDETSDPAASDEPELTAEAFAAVQLELVNANTELATLRAELQAATELAADTQTQLSATEEPLKGLSEIVTSSLKSMSIPLNKDGKAYEGKSPTELVAAFAEVSALFKAKFKTGGVAAPIKSVKAEDTVKAEVDPLFAAAAQLNIKRKGA